MPARSSISTSATPTPMSYDRFKPKFPIDPFIEPTSTANTSNTRSPWTLDADALPSSVFLQNERRVILIIGQPTNAALDPLFASQHLASSILLIASHRPPALPFDSFPAVHTLRLRTPLAIADTGATRLVDVLEWALQVARLWRRNGGPKKQELMEEVSPGTESVRLAQSFGRLRYSVAPDQQNQSLQPPSMAFPGASTTSLTPSTTKKTRRVASLFNRQSSAPVDPDTTSKPFDTILHFLSADDPDKSRLKAAILVTTLTRPYLASPPSRAPTTRFYSDMSLSAKPSASVSGKRWSLFRGLSISAASSSTTLNAPVPSLSHQSPNPLSRSTTDLSDESTRTVVAHSNSATLARLRKSRLIHVMPSSPPRTSSSSRFPSYSSSTSQQQQHVIRSLEAFLLSFAFSTPSARELPAPIAGFVGCDAENARARPYVLPAGSLREILHIESDRSEDCEGHEEEKEKAEWTLAELVLCGALENESEAPRPRHSHFNSGLSIAEGARRISDETRKGKERQVDNNDSNGNDKENENSWMARRAWLGGVRDIVVVRSSEAKAKASANAVEKCEVAQPQIRVGSSVREKERSHSPSQAQAQVQALATRNLNLNSASISPSNSPSKPNSESNALVYPKKEQGRREVSNVKPPAIEKRLPTPPQESVLVDAGARSAVRSQKRQSVPPERREHEREREEGLKSSERRLQPRTRDSVPPISIKPSSTSRLESRPHVSSLAASSTHHQHHSSHHSRTHSPRHHHDYENQLRYERSPRSRSRGHNGDDCEEQVSANSLPTPPDSEEASFENERTPTSHASPSRRYERERRDRDWERDIDMDELEERDRRRRTHSHPSQPHHPSDFDERTPPRRAKTRPMEKPRDRTHMPAPVRPEYLRSASSEERRARRVPVPVLTETEAGTVRMTSMPPSPNSQSQTQPPVSKSSYPMPMQVAPSARSLKKSKSERMWKFWKGVPAA